MCKSIYGYISNKKLSGGGSKQLSSSCVSRDTRHDGGGGRTGRRGRRSRRIHLGAPRLSRPFLRALSHPAGPDARAVPDAGAGRHRRVRVPYGYREDAQRAVQRAAVARRSQAPLGTRRGRREWRIGGDEEGRRRARLAQGLREGQVRARFRGAHEAPARAQAERASRRRRGGRRVLRGAEASRED